MTKPRGAKRKLTLKTILNYSIQFITCRPQCASYMHHKNINYFYTSNYMIFHVHACFEYLFDAIISAIN
ncbi:hypothetical protein Hanom_Chr08g00726731 [Helianthus anomalus]